MSKVNKDNNEEQITPFNWAFIKDFFNDILDLRKGVDKKATIENIKEKKSMSGANAWMLICSIIIASIGLDRDSDAVIIGAMLISPLMSPILGIGLGVGINDTEVVKQSAIHFTIAIIIALITSFIYFSFSPFGDITPSIEARTEPLILDVIIAIFGGLAGIISIARKDLSTTLPGVAIATALMPPLCVTGFGLATGNYNFALNAFYLFLLNTSFITISTYLMVRYFRFPYRRYLNSKDRTKSKLFLFIYALILIIPSFFILNRILDNIGAKRKVENFVQTCFKGEDIYLDDYKMVFKKDSISTLYLKVYGDKITMNKKPYYLQKMKESGLDNWDIILIPSSEVNLKDINALDSKIKEVEMITLKEKEKMDSINNQLTQNSLDSLMINDLLIESRYFLPDATNFYFGKMQTNASGTSNKQTITMIINSPSKIKYSDDLKSRYNNFLKHRTKLDSLKIIYQVD